MWSQSFAFLLFWVATIVICIDPQKISPKLQAQMVRRGTANVFISFGSTVPTLESLNRLQRSSARTPAEKANQVRNSLIKLANADQAGVLNMLQAQRSSMQFEKMWLSNRLYIKNANFELVKQIASMSNVTRITHEEVVSITDRFYKPKGEGPDNGPKDYTYGLKIIQAPEAWQVLGGPEKAGEGVIVGICDTGCNVEHEALKENFVGGEHGYFAPNKEAEIENPGITYHGTHVTGTVVGKKGIGVAPAAKHAQCQVCLDSECGEFALEKCIQFFICPHKQDGSDVDCSKRVHVINIAIYGFSDSIEPLLDAAVASGIILVALAGNSGPLCFTQSYPGLSHNVICTGATDQFDDLAEFSSLGPPIPRDNQVGRLKPDVVAPGREVLSANYDTSEFKYLLLDGTTMASAHVSGLVALLLTRDKTLTQEQVRELIIQNTDQNVSHSLSGWCDGFCIFPGTVPNSIFGYGRINALKTINAQTVMLGRKK